MNKNLVFLILGATLSVNALATPCGEFIYNKHGMLRKYKWAPNTVSENTKKNGIASSTIYPSTENTTASVDPGVTTGWWGGATQSVSSYGPCSIMNQIKHGGSLEDYYKQNHDEIQKQIALGSGGHIDSLATINSCAPGSSARLGALLQKNYSTIHNIGPTRSGEFAALLDHLIRSSELSDQCAGI